MFELNFPLQCFVLMGFTIKALKLFFISLFFSREGFIFKHLNFKFPTKEKYNPIKYKSIKNESYVFLFNTFRWFSLKEKKNII